MNQSPANAAAVSKKSANNDDSGNALSQRIAALEEQVRTLLQLTEYRSLVISRVAHELRTPLTSILGFSEILLSHEQLTSAQRSFCERIQNSAHQLQNSLNQLSDLSHLEAAKGTLRPEEFALEDLLTETTKVLATELNKHGAQLEWKTVPDLPLIVTDRGKLRQTLRILLEHVVTNAKSDAPIDLSATNNDDGVMLAIGAETNQAHAEGSGSKNKLALAVVRYNLNVLGATLTIRDEDPKELKVLVELPFALPAD